MLLHELYQKFQRWPEKVYFVQTYMDDWILVIRKLYMSHIIFINNY